MRMRGEGRRMKYEGRGRGGGWIFSTLELLNL